jgi:hypothetical protein
LADIDTVAANNIAKMGIQPRILKEHHHQAQLAGENMLTVTDSIKSMAHEKNSDQNFSPNLNFLGHGGYNEMNYDKNHTFKENKENFGNSPDQGSSRYASGMGSGNHLMVNHYKTENKESNPGAANANPFMNGLFNMGWKLATHNESNLG